MSKNLTILSKHTWIQLILSLSPLQWEILELLYNKGRRSRQELCQALDKHMSTMNDNLKRPLTLDLVRRFARGDGRKGRPRVFFYLTPLGRKVVEVQLQGIPLEEVVEELFDETTNMRKDSDFDD